MDIRPTTPEDLPELLALTVAVFGPFHEETYRPVVGETVFANRHGRWESDYRDLLEAAHNPPEGRFTAVAREDGQVVGYIAWLVQKADRHGEIDLLAVAPTARRHGLGRTLAEHALAHMRAEGAAVASVGTGGDPFHTPARALYDSLGFTPFPTVSYTKPL